MTLLDTILRVGLVLLGIVGFVLDAIHVWHTIPPAWMWLTGTTVTVWGSHAALTHQHRQHQHEDTIDDTLGVGHAPPVLDAAHVGDGTPRFL